MSVVELLRFRLLGTVLAARLPPRLNTGCVKHTANNGVTKADILYAAATDHNHRVLLKVVTDTWDVSSDLHTVGETNPRDLTDSGVWLLWSLGGDLYSCSPLERRIIENGAVFDGIETTRQSNRLCFLGELFALLLYELVDC